MANETNERQLGKEILKGNERTVTKEVDLTDVDKRYIGDFTFKIPSLMERMRIGIAKTALLNGAKESSLDIISQNIAHMAGTLTVVCTDYPKWFDLNEIDDYIVLETVYDIYLDWENSFRTKDKDDDDGKDSGGPAK